MSLSADRLYPIIVLAALAGVTLWLERVTTADHATASSELRREPDFIAEQTRLMRFDASGARRYELLADKITHYPAADTSTLDRPRLHYDADNAQIDIQAQHGEVRNDGSEIFLSGNVEIVREASPGEARLTLDAETLTVWPDTEQAISNDPVTLSRGTSVARGNAMKTDNLFGTLELIGNTSVTMPQSPRTKP